MGDAWFELHNEAIITGIVAFGAGMVLGMLLMFNEARAVVKKSLRR